MRSLIRCISSFIPTPLPTGMTEFSAWSDSILALSKVPDNDSTRFAVAVMIMHLGSTEDWKAKRYFIKALNKSAANECANAVAMGLKKKQQDAAAALEASKKAEELTASQGLPNDRVAQN